ncbi:MAG: hypothetical protein IT305_18510 [Chloroflexi bacterium]|nr:hypothetical protein [Chloroflexota bacterium]
MSTERKYYRPDSLSWYEELPASPAVRVGDLLFIAGQVDLDSNYHVNCPGDVSGQTREALDSIRRLVEAAGGTLDDVVDIVSFHTDARDIDKVFEIGQEYFERDCPAWTPAGCLGTFTSDNLVSIRAIAHLGGGQKKCFTPESVGWMRSYPMSGGCRKGDLVFVSGQTALGSDCGIVTDVDHKAQARHAYDRMIEIVELAGGSVADILDFSSFHQDIRGAEPTLLEVYIPEVLGNIGFGHAASTSHIGSSGLIKVGVLGTYRALADLSEGDRVASTPESIWWKNLYPIAGGAKKNKGSLITIAGQVACAPDASVVAPGDTAGQAQYIFDCMSEVLAGFGASMEDVVEVTSYHKDPRAWKAVMDVGEGYFRRGQGPAWTPIAVPGLWMEGYLHEISAMAIV